MRKTMMGIAALALFLPTLAQGQIGLTAIQTRAATYVWSGDGLHYPMITLQTMNWPGSWNYSVSLYKVKADGTLGSFISNGAFSSQPAPTLFTIKFHDSSLVSWSYWYRYVIKNITTGSVHTEDIFGPVLSDSGLTVNGTNFCLVWAQETGSTLNPRTIVIRDGANYDNIVTTKTVSPTYNGAKYVYEFNVGGLQRNKLYFYEVEYDGTVTLRGRLRTLSHPAAN